MRALNYHTSKQFNCTLLIGRVARALPSMLTAERHRSIGCKTQICYTSAVKECVYWQRGLARYKIACKRIRLKL